MYLDADNEELSPEQGVLLLQCLKNVKDGVCKLSSEHKDIHGSISKVGRAVDRVSMTQPWSSSSARGDC